MVVTLFTCVEDITLLNFDNTSRTIFMKYVLTKVCVTHSCESHIWVKPSVFFLFVFFLHTSRQPITSYSRSWHAACLLAH